MLKDMHKSTINLAEILEFSRTAFANEHGFFVDIKYYKSRKVI